MGEVFGSLFGSFLIITKAAFPATQKLLTFIESKAKVFENFLDTKAKSGELTAFFLRATKLAGDLGQVLSNIGGFFGDMIKSNFGPNSGGQYMINVLKQSTLNLRNLREEMGATKMDDYFYQAAINARIVLGIIGDMAKGLMALGAMDETQVTFAELRKAGPYLQKWLEEGAKLGPIMAQIVTNFARFMSVFSESGNVIGFFSTINNVIKIMADIMENDVIRAVLSFITQITAFILAVKTLGTIFNFIFMKVILGSIMAARAAFVKMVGTMIGGIKAAQAGFITLGGAIRLMLGPILLIVGTIILAVMEWSEATKRARQETMGALDELNAAARNTATGGMDLLVKSFGDLNGELQGQVRTLDKNAIWFLNPDGAKTIEKVNVNLAEVTSNTTEFKEALSLLAEKSLPAVDGLQKVGQAAITDGQDFELLKVAFDNVGTALSDLARTNLPEATKKFKEIAIAQGLNKEQQLALLNSMPALKSVLAETAGAAGGLAGDQNLLNIAMGKGDDYANAVATQLYGVEGSAKAAQERIDGLKDKIFNFGTVTLDTRAASRAFQQAIDDVSNSLIQNGKGLDDSTEAGRANNAALDSLVSAGKDYAQSVYEQNGNTAELQSNMIKLRDRVAEAAKKMGLGADEAQALADTLIGTKFEIKMTVKTLTKEEATKAYNASVAAIKGAAMKGGNVSIGALERAQAAYNAALLVAQKRDGGYISSFGTKVRHFAPGGPVFGAGTGRSDSIPAMLSNGEFVINANATAKNRSLLEAINSGNTPTNTGSPVSITVNPSPGMDEKELAAEVSRQLAFAMRKGSSY
jgi:hypothetical protein